MKRALLALVVLGVVACAPALEPTLPPAAGVTATVTASESSTLYRVDVNPALDRLVLLFVGERLAANAEECTITAAEVACIVRDVAAFYEVHVGGVVRFAQGVAQRGTVYSVVVFPAASPP